MGNSHQQNFWTARKGGWVVGLWPVSGFSGHGVKIAAKSQNGQNKAKTQTQHSFRKTDHFRQGYPYQSESFWWGSTPTVRTPSYGNNFENIILLGGQKYSLSRTKKCFWKLRFIWRSKMQLFSHQKNVLGNYVLAARNANAKLTCCPRINVIQKNNFSVAF